MAKTAIKISPSNNRFLKSSRLGALCVFCALIFSACTFSSEKLEMERAASAETAGKHAEAFKHYHKVVDHFVRTPAAMKAASEAARIAHYELKKFPEALRLYKHIILYSTDEKQRVDAQRKIADLYFNQTLEYGEAITAYNRLLELPHDREQGNRDRLSIARSYFYLNNFFQAQVEIDKIVGGKASKDLTFEALLLKANIFLTTKKHEEAIAVLKTLIEQYPERSKNETIGLILAICYEEQENYAKAIETLQSIKDSYPRKEFIENKIKVLKERESQRPGARGLKK
ncbi:MAG TPA: tetratricopeptide repeat protein [Bdellovibrionales bacterium]|nr:tetratricopeptide repeat protein [Bdellovibrionales bacterium]